MEASVEQQLTIGSPPQASEFQKDGLWVVMECSQPENTPKVWLVHAYAYVPCRVDWGDGTPLVNIPNEYPVSGAAPGLYSLVHTYPSAGPFDVRVTTANGVYMTTKLFVGPIPYFDSDARRLTMAERWQRELQKKADMEKATAYIGSDPGNSAAPGGTVRDPATKQSDA